MAELTQADREFLAEACGFSRVAESHGDWFTAVYYRTRDDRQLCRVEDWRHDSNRDHLALVLREVERRDGIDGLDNLAADLILPIAYEDISPTAYLLQLMSTDTGVATICAAAWEVLRGEKPE